MKYLVGKGLNGYYHEGRKYPVDSEGIVNIPGDQIKGLKVVKEPKKDSGNKE